MRVNESIIDESRPSDGRSYSELRQKLKTVTREKANLNCWRQNTSVSDVFWHLFASEILWFFPEMLLHGTEYTIGALYESANKQDGHFW